MKYFGEHLETITAAEAIQLLKQLGIKAGLPSYRKSLTLTTKGSYAYQLVNVGNKMFDVEAVRINMRSK